MRAFDDSPWRATDGPTPKGHFEQTLGWLLEGLGPETAAQRVEAAYHLIETAEFAPDESATWRKRFADRLAELQPAAQKVA